MDANELRMSAAYVWLRLCAWIGKVLAKLLRMLGLRSLCRQGSHHSYRMQHVQRKAGGWSAASNSRHPFAKPVWIHEQFFQLAQALPNAGCRTLANNFNQLHRPTGQSISKSWAYDRLKARRHALALARQRSPSQGHSGAIGRVWGMDLTGLSLVSGESAPVWGVLDHGSRTVLQLEPLERFNSLILLGKLLIAFGEYGIPKAVRSDNASVFRTLLFRGILRLLGVQQQFTELHSPWQNGRIERFWRTLKETLGTNARRFASGARILEEQMRFASIAAMREVLSEFQVFYNFSRPHQALKGQTPAQVWQRRSCRESCATTTISKSAASVHAKDRASLSETQQSSSLQNQ
jgi:putative transposase